MKEDNENTIIGLEIEELEVKIAPTVNYHDFTIVHYIDKASPVLS